MPAPANPENPPRPDVAPHVEFREERGGGTAPATVRARTVDQMYIERDRDGRTRSLSIDTEDIIAFGAFALCIGGVAVAVIVALGLVFGKLDTGPAGKIILGCVGGGAIAGVIGAAFKNKAKQKNTGKR